MKMRDALGHVGAVNWSHHFQSLGLSSPLSGDGAIVLDFAAYCQRAIDKRREVWDGVHLSPRTCPSRGAKLRTYHRWFARPVDCRAIV